jgi:beta-glucosidase
VPGETKTVPLSVAVEDLAWYDAATKSWKVEPMTYGIFVGPSSRRADLLAASVTVDDGSRGLEDESI